MKSNNSNTPDFINDENSPETGFELVSINKAKFNGNTYSWSSDAKGWFKDTPNTGIGGGLAYIAIDDETNVAANEYARGYVHSTAAYMGYIEATKVERRKQIKLQENFDSLVSALKDCVDMINNNCDWTKFNREENRTVEEAKQLLNQINQL